MHTIRQFYYSLNFFLMSLKNLSIQDFKAEIGVTSIDIVRNPNTQQLFADANGVAYRVQGADSKRGELDMSKGVEFLYETDKDAVNAAGNKIGGIENGCIVNKGADNLVGTL